MAKHPASHAVFLLGILLLGPTGLARAQDSVLAGVVLSATSSIPLEGARLTIDGSPLIQTTDANGRFRFTGVEVPQVTLRVVRVGYQPAAVIARAGDTDIQIRLREAAVQLNEIVVTGQAEGTERRAVGNSIVTIDAPAALELSNAEDVTRLLNGRAAGVTVVPNSGRIGAGPSLTVRGLGSLSLNTQPLVYIDGVRVNNDVSSGPQSAGGLVVSRLNDVAPEDIESMEIIKGPAAATLYGTEASNGVIQIITKKGRSGTRPQISFTTRQGTNWFQNPEGRIPANFNLDPVTGAVTSQNLVQQESDRGTPIWNNGYSGSYSLSATGGSNAVQYYLSGNYDDDHGIEPTNKATRFAGHAN
ncbi:MAG: TonB-dependent receptor plug domain-containing protein, partial [Gemmatimonadales bacterium]